MKFKVEIRRDSFSAVRPEAEQIDGNVYNFELGWLIEKSDSSIYKNENAMIPIDLDYPNNAPSWIASGDLIEVKTINNHEIRNRMQFNVKG